MKILAARIKRQLLLDTTKWGHCAIYENELQRIWPLNEENRKAKIEQFAKEYGFCLSFYRPGVCAIFEKERHGQGVPHEVMGRLIANLVLMKPFLLVLFASSILLVFSSGYSQAPPPGNAAPPPGNAAPPPGNAAPPPGNAAPPPGNAAPPPGNRESRR